MKAVNYSTVRNHLKEYMDRVAEDYETYIITRKNEKNVVMMSAEEYDNLMENMHLLGHEASRNALNESKRQLEEGQIVHSALLEDEE